MLEYTKIWKEDKQTANLQLVKQTNLALVFDLIYNSEPISRAELAHRTRLSPTTISSLADELLQNGIIIETGAGITTSSGRKPIMLEVNPNGGHVVSVEMVKSGLVCSLYDLKCNLVGELSVNVDDYGLIGEEIVKAINEIMLKNSIPRNKLLGVCVGVPGLIDNENKRVVLSTVITIDENNDFYSKIKAEFADIPVLVENVCCLYAYAEKAFGTIGDIKNLVSININVGIGAGIILEGNVYTGSFGLAGEIGHMSIDINGPRCKCGNKGCLEAMASIPSMTQRIIYAIMSGRETVINDLIENDFNKIDISIIKTAIEQNDELALEVIKDIALNLAYGINNIINLFNPQVIVIEGEMVGVGDVLLENIKTKLQDLELKPNTNQVQVKYSNLKGNITTLGGSKYILDYIFKAGTVLQKNSNVS